PESYALLPREWCLPKETVDHQQHGTAAPTVLLICQGIESVGGEALGDDNWHIARLVIGCPEFDAGVHVLADGRSGEAASRFDGTPPVYHVRPRANRRFVGIPGRLYPAEK